MQEGRKNQKLMQRPHLLGLRQEVRPVFTCRQIDCCTETLCQGGKLCNFRFVRHETDAGEGWERSRSI